MSPTLTYYCPLGPFTLTAFPKQIWIETLLFNFWPAPAGRLTAGRQDSIG
jgi:hypothetical protein